MRLDLLACLGIVDARKWKVTALIVTDRELLAPIIASSKIPIIAAGRVLSYPF